MFLVIFVFSRAARLSTNGLPPALFYLSGLLLWNYFSQSFTSVSQTLVTNVNLFNKVYFPRLVMPVAVTLSNLLAFAIQLVLFIGIYLYYAVSTGGALRPHGWVWLFPLLLLQTALLSLGLGLLGAALTTKYRDLSHLTTFLVQVGMFLTPIIYPESAVPEKYRAFVNLNPFTPLIRCYRRILLEGTMPDWFGWAYFTAWAVAVFLLGYWWFARTRKGFADVI